MHRRLSNLKSGSGVHLMYLCSILFDAGYQVRIVAAPTTSFGHIPFCRPDRVLCDNDIPVIWPGSLKVGRLYISTRSRVWRKFILRALASVTSLTKGLNGGRRLSFPSALGKTLTDREAEEVQRAANALGADLVIAEYSSLAPLLGGCNAKKRGVLMHDLFSSRAVSFQESGICPDHNPITLDQEVARLRDAHVCIHASQIEADAVKHHLPDAEHIWMRPRLTKNTGDSSAPPRVVFIGVKHGGNRAALDMILKEIWPRVWQETGVELWIVGEISKWVEGRHDGVRCVGFVEDLRTLGDGNTIGIAPMLVTSGISIKIGTYLELGMRVVTFKKTLEAYSDMLDGLVTAVDTPEEFTETLIDMLKKSEAQRGCPQDAVQRLEPEMSNEELLEALRCRQVSSSKQQVARHDD